MPKPRSCALWAAAILLAASMSADAAASEVIGLCYRDGSRDAVLEEMLQIEGVPFVRLRDLGRLEELGLRGLVLGEGFDDAAEQVTRFLQRGGVVLAIRPAGRLAEALGLKRTGAQNDGYLTVAAEAPVGCSVSTGNRDHSPLSVLTEHPTERPTAAPKMASSSLRRFQLFGRTELYRGGDGLARLEPGGRVGGVLRVKRGPGEAIVAAFDLAETMLSILQPEAPCGKHIEASRVEYELGDVPQVDLLRRMLVGRLLDRMDVPVLSKWCFPAERRAMLVILGDQDGADFRQLQVVLDLLKELDAPYTLYVTPMQQPLSKAQFEILRQGGMEFCLHPDFFKRGGIQFTEEEFKAQLKKAEADVGGRLLGQRPHSGRWDTVGQLPLWSERAGVQFDAILGERWWENHPLKFGYWVGTGLPYHFFHPREHRRMDVLEIPVFGCDNACFWKPRPYNVRYKPGAHKTFLGGRGYSEDEAFEAWRRFFDAAIENHPAAVGYCWHPVYLAARKLALESRYDRTDGHFRRCVQYARSRGAGLSGSVALNDFWRAREKVALEHVAWELASATLHYKVSSGVKLRGLTLVAPAAFRGGKASVRVKGRAVQHTETALSGRRLAMFTVDAGPEAINVTVAYR